MSTIAENVIKAEVTDEDGNRWVLEQDNEGNLVVKDNSDRRWCPNRPKGYMYMYRNGRRQRISVESFASFGEDAYWSKKSADAWRAHARDMYEVLMWRYRNGRH